jgi:phosphatidylserine decarboxylase
MWLELQWGRWRRAYLKRFRRGYLRGMERLRRREPRGCPHEVLDPRDLKYHRNLTGDCWDAADDPFAWRDRLPVARVGLAEIVLGWCLCLAAAVVLSWIYWPLSLLAVASAGFVAAFFRNPRRTPPWDTDCVVAPADGTVVEIQSLDDHDFVDGPAVQIGIFLSIFNVHINRVPAAVRVIGLDYYPGKFLNALRPRSARENEQLALRLQQTGPPYRKFEVRQIAGAIARRIVCWVRPGDELDLGDQLGLIKFGSRTNLVLPKEPGLMVDVRVGQPVKAGTTVVARYNGSTAR